MIAGMLGCVAVGVGLGIWIWEAMKCAELRRLIALEQKVAEYWKGQCSIRMNEQEMLQAMVVVHNMGVPRGDVTVEVGGQVR